MKINCLSCGHKIDLGDSYDDYTGPVKCFVCTALLDIQTETGTVKSVSLCSDFPHPSAGAVDERTR